MVYAKEQGIGLFFIKIGTFKTLIGDAGFLHKI
jgi:hypothetical protein